MTRLITAAKAGIVALTLGASSLIGLAPSFAQDNNQNGAQPRFSFEFGIGNNGFRFGHDDRFRRDRCISDSRAVGEVRSEGFRNVRIVDENRRSKVALGTRRGYLYEITVSCNGNILDIDRLRRA